MNELGGKLQSYVTAFNQWDEELYPQAVPNARAEEWLLEEIPRIECPDQTIEEIYYFRWWVYRKHLKQTPEGMVISEFLPKVPWSGPYNTINCAAGFHIEEGRWLKNASVYLKEYLLFWLRGNGYQFSYSTWLAWSAWKYGEITGDFALGVELLPEFIRDFHVRDDKHLTRLGLYWSNDDRDCMEMSISGSGLRPTFNSYQYADARAISWFAGLAGRTEIQKEYAEKADRIREKVQEYLWDEDFFKVIPMECPAEPHVETDFQKIDPDHNVRELLGYIPWYFDLPEKGHEKAFRHMKERDGFLGTYGLTTAERRHPRYSFEHEHECLWNGPVWPYATTQALKAAANVLRDPKQQEVTRENYYGWLSQYAKSQYFTRPDGRRVPWIDENMDPDTGIWEARRILEEWGWKPVFGGYERGKDYNHSMFCDLVLSDLLGIGPGENGELAVQPRIPDDWDYFRVENLWYRGKCYEILFDRDGNHYQKGKGIQIFPLKE